MRMKKMVSVWRLKRLLCLLLVALIFTSCTSERKLIKKPIKEEGVSFLFERLKENELHFNTLSAKFNAEYTVDKKKTSLKGQIRLKKDSILWVSLSPALGLEMARVIITPDSVKFLNRLESNYFITDFQYFNNYINNALDFNMLQAFIIGNDFSFYEISKFRASVDALEYRLNTIQRQKLKNYVKANEAEIIIPVQNIWLNPENFKITKVVIKEIVVNSRKLTANYSSFVPVDEQLFPSEAFFEVESAEKRIDIKIDFSKLDIDPVLRFPFRIPSKYSMIE